MCGALVSQHLLREGGVSERKKKESVNIQIQILINESKIINKYIFFSRNRKIIKD